MGSIRDEEGAIAQDALVCPEPRVERAGPRKGELLLSVSNTAAAPRGAPFESIREGIS
jgi:hypothetical protein